MQPVSILQLEEQSDADDDDSDDEDGDLSKYALDSDDADESVSF